MLVVGALLLVACAPDHSTVSVSKPTPVPTSSVFDASTYTPDQIRAAYQITPLLQHGYTGKGETVVLIESFGSPTLQQDIDAYDQRYHLPPSRCR